MAEIKLICIAPYVNTEVGRARFGDIVTVSESWWNKFRRRFERRALMTAEVYIEQMCAAKISMLQSQCRKRRLSEIGERKTLLARLTKGLGPLPNPLPALRGVDDGAKPKKRKSKSKTPKVKAPVEDTTDQPDETVEVPDDFPGEMPPESFDPATLEEDPDQTEVES